MSLSRFLVALLATTVAACSTPAPTPPAAADRLYVMDCGHNAALDQARWSPGVNVGKPLDLSDNCYLIRHGTQWLLWDTGYPDAMVGHPVTSAVGTATRSRTLASQLAEISVAPADIQWVAVSHTHGDHVGNVDLFPQATPAHPESRARLGVRSPARRAPFKRERPVRALQGDLDVFGDGSVTVLSTPGHTPGHQSLLVRLPHTGWIVLSGDLSHFRDNWEHRRVASMNTSAEQTQASMTRVAQLLADKQATLWINHDNSQSMAQRHSPQFYD